MQLNQAEIIQVLRRRANLNQGDFGARAFDTSYESGRTKVKNLELGKQKPTADDLKNMARVLNIPDAEMRPAVRDGSTAVHPKIPGAVIKTQTLNLFPGLEAYLDMLDKAARIDDTELIGHIADKIAGIFSRYPMDHHQEPASSVKG
jgi:transcriptional regulator with XRE-family HTH domain